MLFVRAKANRQKNVRHLLTSLTHLRYHLRDDYALICCNRNANTSASSSSPSRFVRNRPRPAGNSTGGKTALPDVGEACQRAAIFSGYQTTRWGPISAA